MSDLLEVADVQEGDGHWTIGYEVGAFQCGLASFMSDICPPSNGYSLAGKPTGVPGRYRVNPFAARVRLNSRSTWCEATEEDKQVEDLLVLERRKAAGRVLWNGINTSEIWLGATGVGTVTAGATPTDSLAAVLQKHSDYTVGVEPILHLGVGAALRLDWISPTQVRGFDGPVVVNSGYPEAGIGVTGPIVLRFGSTQVIETYDRTVNRFLVEANQLGAVEFDPCSAVVVGALPVHIGGL